jgi:hypothetical protein
MKRWLTKATLLAAITFPGVGGAAWAGGSADLGCSNATLKGGYAFSVLTIVAASPPGPGVVVGLGTFDGKGGFKQTDFPGNGATDLSLTAFRTGQTGSYTVNPDCTGFMTINLGATVGVTTNAFVISNGGQAIRAVIAGFTASGNTLVTPLQSRIDFWKVASEQEQ